MRQGFWAVLLGIAISGCASVYRVSATDNGGIPFLPIESVEVTTVTYEQPWAEVLVHAVWESPSTGKNDKRTAEQRQHPADLLFYMRDVAAARVLANRFAASGDPKGQLDEITSRYQQDHGAGKTFEDAPPDAIEPGVLLGSSLRAVSVTRSREQIPAARPLFLNATVPFGGSGNSHVELSPNGTLAKGDAEVHDDFPGSALTALGTILGTDMATTVTKKVLGIPLAAAVTERLVSVTVTATPVRRLYALSVVAPADGSVRCSSEVIAKALKAGPSASGGCRVSVGVSLVRGDGTEPKKDSAEADNQFEFSGAVKLPKATPAK